MPEPLSPPEGLDPFDPVERFPGRALAVTVAAGIVFILAVIWVFALGVPGLVGEITARNERASGVDPDLQRLRAHEDSLLTGYGWTDRDSGLARIPVQRAMEILAGAGGGGS